MLVNTIPLPRDAESRGLDWPAAGEPSAADLAAIETEFSAMPDAIDWERLAALVGPVRTSAVELRELAELPITELIEMAMGGKVEAFGPLFGLFRSRMVRAAFRRTNDHHLSEEIVSDVWERVLGMAGRWERRSDDIENDFCRLLFGLVRAGISAHYANFWRETPMPVMNDRERIFGALTGAELADGQNDPRREAMRADLLVGVQALCDRQRAIVRLMLDGLDYATIADKTGLTVAQVRGGWATAKVQLRARLDDPMKTATVAQISDAVATLPLPHRQVMTLRLLDKRGVREVATMAGLDYDVTRRICTGGLRMIRERLVSPDAYGIGDLAAARRKREAETERLREAARQLPAAQRDVVLLRLDGMRFSEIAAKLGKSRAAVDGSWRNAQDSLARLGELADASVIPSAPVDDAPIAAVVDLDTIRDRRRAEVEAARQQAQQLPAAQREVALLRLDGLKFSEIGARLGKSKAAIQSAWRAGQASLARKHTVGLAA
jgi:DNA-directed RNA polymerase specialized sigma24 family protein